MNIVVVDGQGGGMGRAIVEKLKAALPDQRIIAVGANALATAAMLKAGADAGATGENAVRYNCRAADLILGPAGIVLPNAMYGEITPAMAHAVGASPALKLLLPVEKCSLQMVGVRPQSLDTATRELVQRVIEYQS
ncbi:MAG TPA: DUF3842 family protein, partial [Clostridia bacterium]|nr:DUF3842 family protein [Clostridia bacterium]